MEKQALTENQKEIIKAFDMFMDSFHEVASKKKTKTQFEMVNHDNRTIVVTLEERFQ